jgi:hypothetical protein
MCARALVRLEISFEVAPKSTSSDLARGVSDADKLLQRGVVDTAAFVDQHLRLVAQRLQPFVGEPLTFT